MMSRDNLIIAAISLIAAIIGFWFYQMQSAPQYISAQSQQAASSLSFDQIILSDLDSNPRNLNEWQTPYLLLNFWAPWCAPCREEIPDLINLQHSHDHQLQIIGISFDELNKIKDFQQEFAFNYPLLLAGNQSAQLNRYFGNSSGGLPFTVLLNPQRQIIWQHSGIVKPTQIIDKISTP